MPMHNGRRRRARGGPLRAFGDQTLAEFSRQVVFIVCELYIYDTDTIRCADSPEHGARRWHSRFIPYFE
jgi:hypothetical protein